MGCDIHAYIESVRDGYVKSVAHVGIDRDYTLFGVLAGVREEPALVKPRGIPLNLGWQSKDEYCLFITENTSENPSHYVTREQAEKWVKSKSSEMYDKSYVTDPDAHTPSWLTTDEVKLCCEEYVRRSHTKDRRNSDLDAIYAMMEVYRKARDGEVRFVFWFDN